MELKNLEPKELHQLARALVEGRVFTNRHLSEPELVGQVFLPLAFMTPENLEKLHQAKPGLMYELLDRQLPRQINGMPTFASVRFLTLEDTQTLFELAEKIEEAIRATLNPPG